MWKFLQGKMTVFHRYWNLCFLYWIFVLSRDSLCYNVDTKFGILYQGSPEEYFGFSVGLLRNRDGNRALITAPKANSSALASLHQPGVLFSCSIPLVNDTPSCEEVTVDEKGNVPKVNYTHSNLGYFNKMDDMWLGVSLDIQKASDGNNNNSVVVCGHLWKDKSFELSKHYSVNGVCYVINSDLDVHKVSKLVPFVNKDYQVIGAESKSYFAFAQAGTSVAFSEDGRYLLLGSPGFHEGTGTLVSYELDPKKDTDDLNNPVIPVDSIGHERSFNAYIGYSITSGRFFGGNVTYSAVGAPRDGNYHGRVYIFQPVDENSKILVVNETKEGSQFGEYFGASVSGIDINNDGFTDLLVGSPFYSEQSGGDEGKVCVYVSNEKELKFFAELFGEKKGDARFGTCIGDIGDLNQDGFNDVAIGAPYEDGKGAVYIYHGSSKGLNKDYSQRIRAEDIHPTITGFGISISRGLDIDDNMYPDLLIGSYSSSNGVLLRTLPVIQVFSELEFHPPKIDRNITSCDLKGEKLSCFNVTYCLRYSGQHAPPSLEFKTELQVDSDKQINNGIVRGFVLLNNEPQHSVQRFIKLDKGTDGTCFQETAYIYDKIKDEITPLQFLLKYELDFEAMTVNPNVTFCKDCPVIDPSSSVSVPKSIPFLVDCGPDNKCWADLVVTAHLLGHPDKLLIIGKDNIHILDITVTNLGETAYATELFVHFPPEVSIVQQNLCDIKNDLDDAFGNTTLLCDLGNSIKQDKSVNFQVKIDLSRVSLGVTSINVYFKVGTVSDELNSDDNELNFPIFFKAESDISISGLSNKEQIPFTEEKTMASVTHIYYVTNNGPSPVDRIFIDISVPVAVNGPYGWVDFLNVIDFEVDRSESAIITQTCESRSSLIKISFKNSSTERLKRSALHQSDVHDETTEEREVGNFNLEHSVSTRSVGQNAASKRGDYVVDCQTALCEKIHCVAGPFPTVPRFTKILLSMQMNLTLMTSAMEAWNRIEFVTEGNISMEREQTVPEKHPDEIKVRTGIVRPGPLAPREIENWIIFLSIGIGILILLLILFALIKIGFFKRKQRDKMRRMMYQADLNELHPDTTPHEAEANENSPFTSHRSNNNNGT